VSFYFFDSSALVKRYVGEVGTAWVRGVTDPEIGARIYVVSITGVEVIAGIARNQKGQSITASDAEIAITSFRKDYEDEFLVVDTSLTIIMSAMSLAERYALRGYDAVQLAAALTINKQLVAAKLPALTLVSADIELNNAAGHEGLTVDDPNKHS